LKGQELTSALFQLNWRTCYRQCQSPCRIHGQHSSGVPRFECQPPKRRPSFLLRPVALRRLVSVSGLVIRGPVNLHGNTQPALPLLRSVSQVSGDDCDGGGQEAGAVSTSCITVNLDLCIAMRDALYHLHTVVVHKVPPLRPAA
jgi:hypothetical protein